jgi:hypothetical protein
MSKFWNFFCNCATVGAAVVGAFCLYAKLYEYGLILLAAAGLSFASDVWLKKRWPGAFGKKDETKPKS